MRQSAVELPPGVGGLLLLAVGLSVVSGCSLTLSLFCQLCVKTETEEEISLPQSVHVAALVNNHFQQFMAKIGTFFGCKVRLTSIVNYIQLFYFFFSKCTMSINQYLNFTHYSSVCVTCKSNIIMGTNNLCTGRNNLNWLLFMPQHHIHSNIAILSSLKFVPILFARVIPKKKALPVLFARVILKKKNQSQPGWSCPPGPWTKNLNLTDITGRENYELRIGPHITVTWLSSYPQNWFDYVGYPTCSIIIKLYFLK